MLSFPQRFMKPKGAVCVRRNGLADMARWREDPDRKPLVLRGARQVGKTWLMREFGRTCYEDFAYFNFDEEEQLRSIFEANKAPRRIVAFWG